MYNPIIERPHYLKQLKDYTGVDIIKVITGVRRCGKSSLLLMYKAWLEKEYGKESVLYISFDGPEFILDRTLDAMSRTLEEKIDNQIHYILLDEVQLINGWENVVNAYYSTGRYEIVITGSNARMLSGELATLLTGRYVEIEMFPLSFAEYLQFRSSTHEASWKIFDEYLFYGGFPVVALLEDPTQKMNLLQSVLDSILFNDIKPKVGLDANGEILTKMVAFLNDAIGYPVSMNSLEHKIKSAGHKMYHDLMSKYISALKASFLYYNAEFHTVKGGSRFGQTEKYYPVDTGIVALTKSNLSENYGVLLENVIFLELKRRGYSVSVGKNDSDSSEIDFIAVKRQERIYIQVTATLNDDSVRKREFHALEAIKDNYPKFILSMDRHDFSKDGIRNMAIPEFLLDTSKY